MEKNRSSKIIAVVALVIAVFGLTLGFAAFSTTLTISSSATVTPSDENFKVYFKNTDGGNTVVGTATTGAKAATAALDGTTATGLSADFTAPGQTVTYTFKVVNEGSYNAFLKSVSYGNIAETGKFKICAASEVEEGKTPATDTLVQEACDGIAIKTTIGSDAYTGTSASIQGKELSKENSETVTVEISYTGEARADGPFTVAFGNIDLTYSTIDN